MDPGRCVVVLFGFFVMGLLAYRTYSSEAPIPARVVGPGNRLLFTGADILDGQQVFLRNGLMEYGSVFGHGAYLGPDFTADYLRTSSRRASPTRMAAKERPEEARVQTAQEFKLNRYDAKTDTLVFTAAQSAAYTKLVAYYGKFFSEPSTRYGLRPKAISDPTEPGTHSLFRLVGLGGRRLTARPQLLLYQQLAARTAGR